MIPPVLDSSSSNLGDITIQEIPGPLPRPVSNGVGVSVGGGRQWSEEEGGNKWHIHVSAEAKKRHMRVCFLEGDEEHHICTTLNST